MFAINEEITQKAIDLPDSDMESSDEEEDGGDGSSSSGEEIKEDNEQSLKLRAESE
jgi:hypothetical protein